MLINVFNILRVIERLRAVRSCAKIPFFNDFVCAEI